MKFVYEQNLQEYMEKTGKKDIIVEVVSSSSSDFEVTELHVHFVDKKQAEFFKTKKNFRAQKSELGEVLLPPYRLEYADTIIFGLKSFLFIKYLTQKGIRL